MKKPTLKGLKAMPVSGNAHDDAPIFNYMDRIVLDESQPLKDRLQAVNYVARKVMGLKGPAATVADLKSAQQGAHERHPGRQGGEVMALALTDDERRLLTRIVKLWREEINEAFTGEEPRVKRDEALLASLSRKLNLKLGRGK